LPSSLSGGLQFLSPLENIMMTDAGCSSGFIDLLRPKPCATDRPSSITRAMERPRGGDATRGLALPLLSLGRFEGRSHCTLLRNVLLDMKSCGTLRDVRSRGRWPARARILPISNGCFGSIAVTADRGDYCIERHMMSETAEENRGWPRGAKLGHSERHLQEHGEWNSASSVRRIPLIDVVEFGEPH
jgi:hypothetical protein